MVATAHHARAAAVLLAISTLSACKRSGCLGGGDSCLVERPCADLGAACDGRTDPPTVRRLREGDLLDNGMDALAAVGDVLLQNEEVSIVIDAIDHPHYIVPTGGHILDFWLEGTGAPNDSINHIFTATGLLPGDAPRYTSLELLDGEDFAAVVVRGHLDGDERQKIATRYELRGCERGVRVRTEYANLSSDDAIVTLADGWYWSGREALPFTPRAGSGFEHPSFGLSTISDVYFDVPFMAAAAHTSSAASYATVSCTSPTLSGFQSDQISALGTPRRIIAVRDHEIFERFITMGEGPGIDAAVAGVWAARSKLFGEDFVQFRGQILERGAPPATNEARVSVGLVDLPIADGDPAFEETPWSYATPDDEGRFVLTGPAGKSLGVRLSQFGVASPVLPATDDMELLVEPPAKLSIDVRVDGVLDHAQVFVHPADDATRDAVTASLLGQFGPCAPLLGPPHGGSPACNRILVPAPSLEFPPGRYELFATVGPFATIARETVTLQAGVTASVSMSLSRIDLVPGRVTADFHVHGRRSFDSSIPDLDRVRSFLAASVDVVVGTDHDALNDYALARAALGADERMVVISGLETTSQVLWDFAPESEFPRVIGHWNFWPVAEQPNAPRRGAPWDEVMLPGQLMTLMRSRGWQEGGIVQLNHPWDGQQFGRDLGFPASLELDLALPLPKPDDSSFDPEKDNASLILSTPPGSRFSNADYDAQEVMNGSENHRFLAHRAYWFYLLNQGIVRAGTANSDSHGLTDNVLGTPRTVVTTEQRVGRFDVDRFNEDVRSGRMFGTNGPVIEVIADVADGSTTSPSVSAFVPGDDVRLRVTAAAWVPVEEVRIYINGRLARTIRDLPAVTDVFEGGASERYAATLSFAGLLDGVEGDAWIVFEAGAPLTENVDLDCDGVPDTGDNNADGLIDWRDVDRNDDDVVDARDLDEDEDGEIDDAPKACDSEVGPLADPAPPTDRGSPAYPFWAVSGAYPLSFTNPLILDRDGGGFSGARR